MNEYDEPTDTQIEEEEIERQIEYQEEVLRGEHGEAAQRRAEAAVRAIRDRDRELEERRELEQHLHKELGCPLLVQACMDPLNYALKLRSGEVIRFTDATYHDNGWISLFGITTVEQFESAALPYLSDNGMDVRVDEILWVMDAPKGS